MKSRILAYIILCIVISAQSCIMIPNFDEEWVFPELSGIVVDSISQTPIQNAKVKEWSIMSDDTLSTDAHGQFRYKAKREYIKFKIIAMDPPYPYIKISVQADGYEYKEIELYHKNIVYSRKVADTIDCGIISLVRINNLP